MDFELNEEQQMFRTMVRDFVDNEVAPHAAEWDETEEFPRDVIRKMTELGICGLHLPEEYGGSGDDITFALACEEFARGSAGLSSILSQTVSLAMGPIVMFGNEDQKRHYVGRVANDGAIAAFALTEAMAICLQRVVI